MADGIVTIYRCQGCGKEHAVSGGWRLNASGPYCSNHDPDGSGEIYVAVRHEVRPLDAAAALTRKDPQDA